MTRFLLIRHALTDAVGKRLSGRTKSVSLSEQGQTQARQLAKRLAHLPVRAIYSSPLERAVETAEPIAKIFNLQTISSGHFLEIDFGEWTNCSFEELGNDPRFQRFNTFRSVSRIPGGETMVEAQIRMITGLQNLCIEHRQELIAVISHADLIKAAVTYYAGIHLDLFHRIEISPASVSIIEIYDETARVLLVNDTGEIKM